MNATVRDSLTSEPVSPLVHSTRPAWKLVIALSLPVLAQQFLIWLVMLSDRFLAGLLPLLSRNEVISDRVMAVTQLGAAGFGLIERLGAAECSWWMAEQIAAREVAFHAAQTTANYLAWFVSSYTVLVSVGSTALVSRFIGAGDVRAANKVMHQSLMLGVVLGTIASVIALAGGLRWLVSVLQLRGETAEFAVLYLQPIFALLVFQILESAGIACLVGAGDTRTGLWVMLGVAIVNLPFAWGLVLGWGPLPRMGFVGIAMGTALSHALGSLVVLTVLARGRYNLRLQIRLFESDWDLIRRILRISVPAGLDSLSVIVGQFWFLSIINQLGNVASGAHGIAIVWEGVGFLSGTAFGTAAMALVGQNLGARQYQRAAHMGWVAFAMGCAFMSLMGAMFFTFAEPMFRLFCPYPSQEPIVLAGVPVLRLVAFAMPMLACTIVFTHALRGAGDTRVPVLFTWLGFFLVRIPLAYFLTLPEVDLGVFGLWAGFGLGLFGAWLAMFADLTIRGLLFFWRFASGTWKATRV